jgi:tripartite-type tricarboxylate transporter receptor subunit TctC
MRFGKQYRPHQNGARAVRVHPSSGKRDFLALALTATLAVAASVACAADPYPSRPVRMIAPFSAGGGADIVARTVAQTLTEVLSQQVIVDNRPGASNIIGTDLVAKSAPDGYTIMIANSVHTINAGLARKLPYDSIRDFAPISLVATTPFMMISNPSLPAKSVRELIALAKSKPGQLYYASPGAGTAAHLAFELFKLDAGVEIMHVPYKGVTQALVDTIAGTTQVMILSPTTALAQVKAGKVRALAVTGAARSDAMPDVPTMQEEGVKGYEFTSWYGLLAPHGVPRPVIRQLNAAVVKSLQQADLRSKLQSTGTTPQSSTSEAFGVLLRREIEKFENLARRAKLKID